MRVLAADIGGTKTLLQIAEIALPNYETVFERRYKSAEYSEFTPMIDAFLHEARSAQVTIPSHACFAVAGPVKTVSGDQTATVTNLPWGLSANSLGALCGFRSVTLINDFEAVGIGIDALQADDLVFLQGEPETQAPRIIIGAGTGLGVAQMIWREDHYHVLASEGGHADFAPNNGTQTELLKYLWTRFEHVSYDRILSGPGLINIYTFLSKHTNTTAPLLSQADPAAAISKAALERTDQNAVSAMDIFVDIYGAQAGNLALLNLAYGGVFVAGGIAPKILNRLKQPDFISAFNRKGRMSNLVTKIPVAIVLNEKVGLMGAALHASRVPLI